MGDLGNANTTSSGVDLGGHGSLTALSRYTPSYLTYTLLALCLTLIATRTLSSRRSTAKPTTGHGAQTVPAVPYWLPLLGHLPNMGLDADGFVKRQRRLFTQGIFALNFGGTAHNVMYTPGLATALLNQKTTNADAEHVSTGILQSVFGYPKNEVEKFNAAHVDMMNCYRFLLTEPGLGEMVGQTARRTCQNVINLVTFSASVVDQTPWERTSDVRLKTNARGQPVAEASLFPLVRDFCAQTALPTIMGSNLLQNFPDIFEEVWTVDRGFLLLATGLPRWLPIPPLTRAHIARKKLLDMLCKFHAAMEREASGEDPGKDWHDLDDVGAVVRARMDVYRKFGFSVRARAAVEHSLMWASNANSNTLVFWMINRVYADPELLARIRAEIAPYVRAVQPRQSLKIPEPPRFAIFDVEGLCNHCPLLKSCYVESLRLDTASWSFKVVKQDFVLQARGEEGPGWLLRKGQYAHVAHDLHNTDPACFESPMEWKADRHVRFDEKEGREVADLGTIRPYGGGSSMCKGRSFAFKECMAFSAAIIAVWEMEPAGGKGAWKLPRHRKATGVYSTDDVTRVWLRRRELPQEES